MLVTHQIQFINRCNNIIIFEKGKIKYFDKYQNLKKNNINIESWITKKEEDINKDKKKTKSESVDMTGVTNEIIDDLDLELSFTDDNKDQNDIELVPINTKTDKQPITIPNTNKTIRNLKDLLSIFLFLN